MGKHWAWMKKETLLTWFSFKGFFLILKKNRKSSGKCRSKTISRPKFVMISGTYKWIRYDRILSRSGYKMTSNQQILIYFELCLVTRQFRKYSSKLVLWTFFQWAKNVIKKQLCVSLVYIASEWARYLTIVYNEKSWIYELNCVSFCLPSAQLLKAWIILKPKEAKDRWLLEVNSKRIFFSMGNITESPTLINKKKTYVGISTWLYLHFFTIRVVSDQNTEWFGYRLVNSSNNDAFSFHKIDHRCFKCHAISVEWQRISLLLADA